MMNKKDLIEKLKNDGIFKYDGDIVGATRKTKSQFFEKNIEYDKYLTCLNCVIICRNKS